MSTGKICLDSKTVENGTLCILYLVWSFFCNNMVEKSWSQWRWFYLSGGKICCRYLECSFLFYPLPNYEKYEEAGQKISTIVKKKRCCIRNPWYGKQGRICLGFLFWRVWVIFLVNNQMVFLSSCLSSI